MYTFKSDVLFYTVKIVSACCLVLMSMRADASTAQALVADLASDDIPWNAQHAVETLIWTNAPPIQLLEAALDSGDYQQRQFAAYILMQHTESSPSERLIEVVIEGLRDDHIPWDRRTAPSRYNYVFNAAGGMRFLTRHAISAKKQLVAALDSNDFQQRFVCAYALGMNGITHRLSDTASILLFHLRDNDIVGDACKSCAALYRLGPAVKPFLLAALENADTQQRDAIKLILLDFESPPKTRKDFEQRRKMHKLSEIVSDPAVEYDGKFGHWPFGLDRAE